MALTRAGLLRVGTASTTGAIQVGSGLAVTADGLLSATGGGGGGAVDQIIAGTGINISPATGVGNVTISAPVNNVLPPQAGQAGNALITDGSNVSFQPVVRQIVPGSNITISPISGNGVVTINSTGGGGGGGGLTGLQLIDDISGGFNGTTQNFVLQIAGVNLPAGTSTEQLIIIINGTILDPGPAFSFNSSNSTITFTTAPTAGQTFIGYVGGSAAPITEVAAGNGLTGGGTVGTVTLNVNAGAGLAVTADAVQLADTTTTTGVNKLLVNYETCTVTANNLTVTLPAAPVVGTKVGVIVGGDFINTVVARNGSNIMGLAQDITLDIAYASVEFLYVDSTNGWRLN